MSIVKRSLSGLSAAGVVVLAGCAGAVSDAYVIENDPGSVRHVDGTDVAEVSLTESAAERLNIRTRPVRQVGGRLTVPSAAAFVDPEGVWWVYTNPEPYVFVRESVDVLRERALQVYYVDGPELGSRVVTVGVAELAGIEDAIGH